MRAFEIGKIKGLFYLREKLANANMANVKAQVWVNLSKLMQHISKNHNKWVFQPKHVCALCKESPTKCLSLKIQRWSRTLSNIFCVTAFLQNPQNNLLMLTKIISNVRGGGARFKFPGTKRFIRFSNLYSDIFTLGCTQNIHLSFFANLRPQSS